MTRRAWSDVVGRVALLAGLGACVVGVLAWSGIDVTRALSSLIDGAVGSTYALFSATLVRATPLVLTGLAVTIAFRAGVLNIGVEGQFLTGATVACAVGLRLHTAMGGLGIPVMLAAGALGGALAASVAAWLRTRFGVLEVISTILLNFVVADVVGYLVRGPMQESTRVYPQSASLDPAAHLPPLIPGTRLHVGFLIAIASCVLAWAALRYSAAGFRLRVVGANPRAARAAGQIDVERVTVRAFLLSGAIAGLAGAIELTGVTFAMYENLSPGYGFTAIAVALMAGLNPLAVIGTGVFFGALEAGGAAMQRDAGVPAVLVAMIEALVIFVILAMDRARLRDWWAAWDSRRASARADAQPAGDPA